MHSASISVSINGSNIGFFSCTSGVRQSDPFSIILFCLVEDVLSRGISSLFSNKKLKLIKASKNATVPYHVLYVDDIKVFCRCDDGSIQAIKNLFHRYAMLFG